jgi:hypothetical protein
MSMAKSTSNSSLTVLTRLKREAAKATTALQKEIMRRESELSSLRSELGRWQAISSDGKSHGAKPKARKVEKRLDWNRILTALPGKFTTKDVQRKSGKPLAQVYSGLGRWTKEKKVRRVEGGYERVAEKS